MTINWINQGNESRTVGVQTSIQLNAFNSANYGDTISFQLISGSLPDGMVLSGNTISGTPIYPSGQADAFSRISFSFIVRASSSSGIADKQFTILVLQSVNESVSWSTPAGTLGTVPDGDYYSLQLLAEDSTGLPLTYSFVSGVLPDGMQLIKTGYLQGVPTIINSVVVDQSQTYQFTVRAQNPNGKLADRSFTLSVTSVYGPVISPQIADLGTYFDGNFLSKQLFVSELNPEVKIQWDISDGALPLGVTLNPTTGLLSGYIQPLQLTGAFGPIGYDGDTTQSGIITTQQDYDYAPYDFNEISQNLSYSFTVRAFDGVNYDMWPYTINVVSRSGFTADSSSLVNDTVLTVDSLNQYYPILLNSSNVLPIGRQSSYYAFKFDGYDFQGDTITYSVSSNVGTFDAEVASDDGFDFGSIGFDGFDPTTQAVSNLPGLVLDSTTGWLYGKLNSQTAASENFTFGINVSKVKGGVTYTSPTIYFTLTVLGDVNNTINWVTPPALGTILNGSTSDLSVVATSTEGKPLIYMMVDQAGIPCRLPQGLKLLPSGEISGRVSFEAFAIDEFTTTFDGGKTTDDRTYNFYCMAQTTDLTASSTQDFTLVLAINDFAPYDNLYLRAMPPVQQRNQFLSIINDTEIFDPAFIYRPTDPYFGVQAELEMLFLSGLNAQSLSAYQQALNTNHFKKQFNFGQVKTAIVLDDAFAVKYEVVYVELIDPANSVPMLSKTLAINPYKNSYTTIYPNSSADMIEQLFEQIGYQDRSTLPPWMSSNQRGGNSTFSVPLGYTQAIVLAYCQPNCSEKVAFRLNQSGLNFNGIEFVCDRYLIDNYYSTFYNYSTGLYIGGEESTFDAVTKSSSVVASANYGVTVPFTQINGRPLSYIQSNGGIDGITNFSDGQTLIFIKQENFNNAGLYDGWVDYVDAFIGDNILTAPVEGYGSEPFDSFSVIPGYLEKIQGTSQFNERGGLWKINLVDSIVNLTFVQEVELNQSITVLGGKTYNGAIMYLNPIMSGGQSVPQYSLYTARSSQIAKTTFNGATTRFFTNRDQYYVPDSADQYVNFPSATVFSDK